MQILEYRGTTIGFPDHFTEDDMAEVVSREESKAKNLAQLFMQEMGQSQDGGAAPRMGQGRDRDFTTQEKLDMAATTTMGLPIVGDVAGLAADFHMYATDEGSRNWINYLFTAAGMLPFVPAASQIKRLAGVLDVSELPAPHTALHGSPSLDRIENYDLSHPKRTDYGYLGEGVYATDVENRFIAKAYAGDGGKILDVEMPAGRYADFLYDENYRDNIENFARELGVDAEPKTSAWAAQFSEKMRDAGYVGARGLADDGSMIEAVIYQNKKKPKKIIAYHGSPHDFDKFDISKIGTGEGAQAYGHGLYFAESEDVARSYRDALTREAGSTTAWRDADGQNIDIMGLSSQAETGDPQALAASALRQASSVDDEIKMVEMSPDTAFLGGKAEKEATLQGLREFKRRGVSKGKGGRVYQVEIDATPDELLDWDAPFSEQSEFVRGALLKEKIKIPESTTAGDDWGDVVGLVGDDPSRVIEPTGKDVYDTLRTKTPTGSYGDDLPMRSLRKAGIKGIKYKDGFSRGTDGGTSNYVIFDDRLITIAKKYGVAIPVAAGILAKETGEDTEQSYKEM